MVKTSKSHLLGNQKADDLETWYASLGTRVCHIYSNDDPGMTLTSMLLFDKKVKQWCCFLLFLLLFFTETIVVYDIEVGRCSQPNEYMKHYEY